MATNTNSTTLPPMENNLTTSIHNGLELTLIDGEEGQEEELFLILYQSMLYLLALYIVGDVLCGKVLRLIPPLVGQIAVGLLLGPHGLNWINANMIQCWPIVGELGLVLMMCQAGLEMDFYILKAVGPRGALMALVGSILPTTIGFLLAHFILNLSVEASLAVGCSFGPTSAGVALNVLQPCHVLNTPLGQLIVAIAIVDDIIALVVLSQLQALTGSDGQNDTVSVASVVIPIVSALLWLFIGGAVALFVMPTILSQLTNGEQFIIQKFQTNIDSSSSSESTTNESTPVDDKNHDQYRTMTLMHIMILLFGLLPATYYSQASHLLGAFLAGLSVCQQPNAASLYNHELDKTIQWLLRIFFGASIAFQIPIQLFQDGAVIGTGFLLSLSLLGKIMTGPLLTPVHLQPNNPQTDQSEQQNGEQRRRLQQQQLCTEEESGEPSSSDVENPEHSTLSSSLQRRRYDLHHLRDCLVVGFSMAGEAEFAMLVAGFGYSEGLVEEETYASTCFAILLSTILSPCLLRLTLALSEGPEDANREENKQD